MLLLHIIEGTDRGKRFELPSHEPQLIGRSTEALPISDETVSRRHAEITPDDGKWYLNDLDSSNGTYVNGKPVLDRIELHPGDRIRCGNLVAVLEQIGEPFRPTHIKLLDADDADINITATVETSSEAALLKSSDPLAAAMEHLRIMYRLIALTGPTFMQSELLEKAMELIFEDFRPERGLILLGDQPNRDLEPAVVRYASFHRRSEHEEIGVGRKILVEALQSGHGVLASKAMSNVLQSPGVSQTYTTYSVICVPIRTGDRVFGAIHIENSQSGVQFTEAQLQLLNVIGQHVGLALHNTDLLASKVQNERLATVGQTVASLSHSIKNILQGLRGGADAVALAIGRDDLNMAKEGWPILNRNLDRIFALTLNMLAFSKPQTLEIELINLNQLIEEVVDLVRPQCARKRAKLALDLEDDLPPIPADPNAIHQALMNLLFNAVEAVSAKRGLVTVRSRYLPDTKEAEIAVIDNGPGIDPALRKHIYEAFTSSKGQRGTGLGLAVTRKIIDDHGGHLSLDTQLGHGATFTIFLPTDSRHSDPDDTKQPKPLPNIEIDEEL